MNRPLAFAAVFAGLIALAGCQTWRDKADADALNACEQLGDAAARKACRTEVVAAAAETEQRRLDTDREAALAREEQEALREAYGQPKNPR
jgi:hypothetical protein